MKKSFALLLAASMLLTAGCSKKAEEIKTVEETQTEVSRYEETQDDFAQFRTVAEIWNDDVYGTVRGEEEYVPIYASLKLPEYTQSVVVEGKRLEFNEEYKKTILKGIFGEEDIYFHDLKHQTTEELEEYLNDREKLVDRCYYDDDTDGDNWQDRKIKEIKEYLEESKSEYTKATSFSEDEYIAKRNGEWYIVQFYIEDGTLIIYLQTKEDKIPEGLREQIPEGMNVARISYAPTGIGDWENSCKFSREEAEQEVLSLVEKLGNSNLVPGETEHLGCSLLDETRQTDDTYFEHFENCGYRVYFDRGVNGERVFGQAVWADVTDEGITRLGIYNPMEQTRVSEHVTLLSLDKIKAAFKKELTQNLELYFKEERKKIKFDTLELLYMWQMKDAATGEGAYIPVWALKDTTQYQDVVQVYVNAIDGTVLDEENLR